MSAPLDAETYRTDVARMLDDLAACHGWEREPGRRRRLDAEHGPAEIAAAKQCQQSLLDHGLTGVSWPREYGGQGLSIREQVVVTVEAQRHEFPVGMFVIGLGMCGPTLLAEGTEDQKRRYLPPMLSGAEVWCQMFSEPAAGSDVAGLLTRAVRDGDDWVLDGQKTWTSGAHYADYGLVLARTDSGVPKHQGLTLFILDMKAPGLTIRPIHQIDGRGHFNEVFLDSVRIPAAAVVGVVGGGWRAATATLANERVALGALRPLDDVPSAQSLIARARIHGRSAEGAVRSELVDLWIDERLVELLADRITGAIMRGAVPGPSGSVAKLVRTAYSKRSAQLAATLAGPEVLAWPDVEEPANHDATALLYVTALSIAGGTDEILRTVIGERILGLPKEPQVDRDVPFHDLVGRAK